MSTRKEDGREGRLSAIELVAILAIVALVCTVPVAAAKQALLTKTQLCQQHLRKIHMAQAMYAADNDGWLAPKIFMLNGYLGYKTAAIPAVTGCPAVPDKLKRKVYYGAEYGKNGYMFLERRRISSSGNPRERRNKLAYYEKPEQTMMYIDFPPEPKGGLGAVLSKDKWIRNGDEAAFRHHGKVNCMFLDGHVVELEPGFATSRTFWGY